MPTLHADPLIQYTQQIFQKVLVPAADAEVVARSLVDANLCGHDSHGVMRVPQYVGFLKTGQYAADKPLFVMNETPAIIAADAGWGLGQVQSHRLLNLLIPKAKTLGVACGTLKQCGHAGRLGEYAERCAKENLAFFGAVNSHGAGRRVAPPGGTQGRISTNPICFGAPTNTNPVVLDFGTSAVAEGKVRVHFQKNEPTPEGWLTDHEGKPTTNPAVLYTDPRGCILPFGGPQMYKGFGLGLLVDLLCGGLSGGLCSSPNEPMAGMGNAVVFVVFDPAAFGGTDHFLQQTTGLTDFIRSCPTAPGQTITLPGDPERNMKAARLQSGINIPDGTWKLIVDCAVELGVSLPEGV